jgi:hypothetical protein
MLRHRKVCCTDKSTQYSVVPLGVLVTITFRRRVNARTACSALLLFHGTLSQSRNVNSLSRFLLIRFCKEELASVVHCMAATSALVSSPTPSTVTICQLMLMASCSLRPRSTLVAQVRKACNPVRLEYRTQRSATRKSLTYA